VRQLLERFFEKPTGGMRAHSDDCNLAHQRPLPPL
jgi:hypothetical protein